MSQNTKGLSGLANLGNTCYINTCMQILSHTTILNKVLDNLDYGSLIENHKDSDNIKQFDIVILNEWNNLRLLLWKNNCTISPNRWISTVQQISRQKDLELFSGFIQNDVTEFLLFILDCFHNAMAKEVEMSLEGEVKNNLDILANKCLKAHSDFFKSNYSEIIKSFYGMEVNLIQDLNSVTLTQSYDPFSIISLALDNNRHPNLIDLFDNYHKEEELGEDNLWENEKKEKIKIKKTIRVWNYPDVLIIFIKRWNPINNRKDQRIINFPLENLNLSKYVIGYNPHEYIYDLYGICNHSGGNDGGHYSAYIRHATNKQWYHFNDTNVKKMNESSVVSNKAYCLFYNKKNIH